MKENQVFKCYVCGKCVEVLHDNENIMVCCNTNMLCLNDNLSDGAKEKHIPIIEKKSNGYLIKVGSIDHPMTKDHYIEWIEIVTDDSIYRKKLKIDGKPEVFFDNIIEKSFTVREYCNLHGMWITKYKE